MSFYLFFFLFFHPPVWLFALDSLCDDETFFSLNLCNYVIAMFKDLQPIMFTSFVRFYMIQYLFHNDLPCLQHCLFIADFTAVRGVRNTISIYHIYKPFVVSE